MTILPPDIQRLRKGSSVGHAAITPSLAPNHTHKNVSPESCHNLADVCVAVIGRIGLAVRKQVQNFCDLEGIRAP